MQLIIDNLDRDHFERSSKDSYKQFLFELDKFMSSWGLGKHKVVAIEGFNNTIKIIYHNEEYLLTLKEKSLLKYNIKGQEEYKNVR